MGRFVPNPDWGPAFLRSDGIAERVSEAGDKVLELARANAASHIETGQFEASLHKADGHNRGGRPYSRIYSDDPAALSIEFGTQHSQAVRALGRAIRGI